MTCLLIPAQQLGLDSRPNAMPVRYWPQTHQLLSRFPPTSSKPVMQLFQAFVAFRYWCAVHLASESATVTDMSATADDPALVPQIVWIVPLFPPERHPPPPNHNLQTSNLTGLFVIKWIFLHSQIIEYLRPYPVILPVSQQGKFQALIFCFWPYPAHILCSECFNLLISLPRVFCPQINHYTLPALIIFKASLQLHSTVSSAANRGITCQAFWSASHHHWLPWNSADHP